MYICICIYIYIPNVCILDYNLLIITTIGRALLINLTVHMYVMQQRCSASGRSWVKRRAQHSGSRGWDQK